MRRGLNAQWDFYIDGVLRASINTPEEAGYPRAHLKRAPGWDSLPEIDDIAVDAPIGIPGEEPQGATTRGKTQTLELQLESEFEDDLNSFRSTLRAAFGDRTRVGLLVCTPWTPYGDDIWATYARASAYDGDDQQDYPEMTPPSGWMRDPIASFRQIDGRWYWWNESGDFGVPMSWDFALGGDVTNNGDGEAPTDPVITVLGVEAGQDVHIGRTVVGGSAELWFRQPGAGDLVVDFASRPRRALLGGVDVTDSLDESASTWWDPFVEGVPAGTHNLWRGAGTGTGIHIEFFSASW